MGLFSKYVEILKSKKCSRKDYWIYFGIMWAIFIVIYLIEFILENYYQYGFNLEFYSVFCGFIMLFLLVICLLLQVKRLRDARLSPWWLLLYLFALLGNSFGSIASIIILILLCFPSQEKSNIDVYQKINVRKR